MLDSISLAYIMLNESILLETRLDFLKANTPTLSVAHDQMGVYKTTPEIIDHFSKTADPSKNKRNTQYIIGMYRKGLIRQEDSPRIKDALGTFEKYQHKLPIGDRQLSLARYPTLSTLEDTLYPYVGTVSSNTDAETNLGQPGHELRYEDDKIKIYKLTSEDASKNLYGGGYKRGGLGTSWCTAARSDDCAFDSYNKKGPLQVIHRKSDGKIFQAHAVGNQFMDNKDDDITNEDLISLAPGIHKAWALHPDLLEHPEKDDK